MKRSKLLLLLSVFACFSGCAITRYYKTDSLSAQVQQMREQLDTNRKRMEEDFWSKQDFVVTAEKSGVDMKQPPYDKLAARLDQLSAAKEGALRESASARREMDGFTKTIAGKSQVRSDDPLFGEIPKFEKRSEKIEKTMNAAFASYTDASNEFAKTAGELKVIPVDVASFDRKISASISDIGRQSALVESTITQFERKVSQGKSNKKAERLSLLNGMRSELSGVRSIRDELTAIRQSFLQTSRGQRAYLITPQHPSYEIFQSLSGVQERAAARVTAFQQKVDAFNQIRD